MTKQIVLLIIVLLFLIHGALAFDADAGPDGPESPDSPDAPDIQGDAQCTPGNCPGDPICGDTFCDPTEQCGSSTYCQADCGSCCGLNGCEPGEDCNTCPGDCGSCCQCSPGQSETGSSCGNCGTQRRDCDGCNWGGWYCTGEGCTPGTPADPVYGSCGPGNCGEAWATASCQSNCQWSEYTWGPCGLKPGNICYSGNTQSQGCCEGGTQGRTCEDCQWGEWGKCSAPCCSTSPCGPAGWQNTGSCGICGEGTQQRYCDGTCWTDSYQCINQGCTPGTPAEPVYGECGPGNCGEAWATASCQSNCQWSGYTWGPCGLKFGNECYSNAEFQTQDCGNCGTQSRTCFNCHWPGFGPCTGEGPCSPGSTECISGKYQFCVGICQWINAGTDNDGDGLDAECGDQCDNTFGISTPSPEVCDDVVDNDCDGLTDCADSDCTGNPVCGCSTAADCPQGPCQIEACNAGICSAQPRPRCDNTECPPSQYCDSSGGNCFTPLAENQYSCSDGIDNDCDNLIDCADSDCAGPLCGSCLTAADCPQSPCTIEQCISNACTPINRPICDTTECPAGQYCDAPGGNCMSTETSQSVCENCVADQTFGYTWVNGNHQDAGIKYSTNTNINTLLFDSNGGACPALSCIKAGNDCHCYDTTGATVNHKSALGTGNCCGNNPNEFYKPDYYGGECTSDVNDCVWSSGNTQSSNTGNAEWWCLNHEWNQCVDSNLGSKAGTMCCAGTWGNNNKWTAPSQVLQENQYSCIDGKDNDCDGLIDCQDNDCDGTISGTVKDSDTSNPISGADVDVLQGLSKLLSLTADGLGHYGSSLKCGSYVLSAAYPEYIPNSQSITLPPNGNVIANFKLKLGTSCESDCTFANNNLIHSSCAGINGCTFCDDTSKAACEFAQPGWHRDYDATHYVVCASGCPKLKKDEPATVTCQSGKTLVKAARIMVYNGKPVKLTVAICG